MSVEYERDRTPQPEKWMIEHEPWTSLGIFVVGLTAVLLIGFLA